MLLQRLKPRKCNQMSQQRSKELEDLRLEWYAKLKQEGFKDIERFDEAMKTDAGNNIQTRQTLSSYDIKSEYYRIAGHFLHDHKFENEFDRKVWEQHCEGISIRSMEVTLSTYRY